MSATGSPSDREAEALSELLRLVDSGRATNRSQIATSTATAPSTVTHRVNTLVERGLVTTAGQGQSRGGRRPSILRINPHAGVLLAAAIGATRCRFAVTDLALDVLAETETAVDIDAGPEHVLGIALRCFTELLDTAGRARSDVRAIGVGLPGPIDTASATVVRPPMMAGWDGYRLRGAFPDLGDVPVVADNDANTMALGEYRARGYEQDPLLFLKVSTGIGCGIVSRGRVHTGANGAAGDIGHVRLAGYDHVRCACGNTGCVMAVASGGAIARSLRELGLGTTTSRDVAELFVAGNVEARQAVRSAAREIGEVVATIVSFYNPMCIAIGGIFALLSEDVLSDIRSVVYGRALPLTTHALRIERSKLGERAGLIGAALMAQQHVFSPGYLVRLLG